MAKERIYLTDITLHAREGRQTANFAKAAEKGRIYVPLPHDPKKPATTRETGTSEVALSFPPDLQARIDRGEVEIMIPKDGLPIIAGADAREKAKKMAAQERRELIHRSLGKSWRKT